MFAIKHLLSIIILLTVLCNAYVKALIVCPPNACDTVRCAQPECKPGQVEEPGYCGCCTICVTLLNEGQPCFHFVGGPPPSSRCGADLICSNGRCVRINLN